MNDAIDTEHVFEGSDTVIRTRWFNDGRRAASAVRLYRRRGAAFASSFKEDGVLGRFRVVGHFRKEQP